MKYLLISCGCAECNFGGNPLIEAELFDTLEDAKSNSWIKNREWKEHPQGGWYLSSGQGDDWIIEVPDIFVLIKKE
ncbi:MAG TPA: hypothetical protein VIJ87_02675 [Pyrinomonadaceae bacterium]|jgi:hypothetical protein